MLTLHRPNEGDQLASGIMLVKGNLKISVDDFAANTELIQVMINPNEYQFIQYTIRQNNFFKY